MVSKSKASIVLWHINLTKDFGLGLHGEVPEYLETILRLDPSLAEKEVGAFLDHIKAYASRKLKELPQPTCELSDDQYTSHVLEGGKIAQWLLENTRGLTTQQKINFIRNNGFDLKQATGENLKEALRRSNVKHRKRDKMLVWYALWYGLWQDNRKNKKAATNALSKVTNAATNKPKAKAKSKVKPGAKSKAKSTNQNDDS